MTTPVRAVALDFGHTVMDERLDIMRLFPHEPHHLMPGAVDALEGLAARHMPVAIWANTRIARAGDVRAWFARAGLAHCVTWFLTSEDAGVRKPAPGFFDYALREMGLGAADVLFVGNQRNTDIAGGESHGIRTVYLTDRAYRSADDEGSTATATYNIPTLHELPALLEQLQRT